ncbi:MAG: hypothetical protein ACOCVT_01220, partial [bacterium]
SAPVALKRERRLLLSYSGFLFIHKSINSQKHLPIYVVHPHLQKKGRSGYSERPCAEIQDGK